MHILVISSCTGKKGDRLNRFSSGDALLGLNHIRTMEARHPADLVPAESLYTGGQHMNLMEGIEAWRASGNSLDFQIVSAGYGIVPCDQKIVSYEVTFQGRTIPDIQNRAGILGIPTAFRRLLSKPGYDLALLLLGKSYLTACDPFAGWKPSGKVLAFCDQDWRKRLGKVDNVVAVPANQSGARTFGAGVLALKGKLGTLVLQRVLENHEFLNELFAENANVLDLLSGYPIPRADPKIFDLM